MESLKNLIEDKIYFPMHNSLQRGILDNIYFPMHNSLQRGILDNLGGGGKILGNIHIRISSGIRYPIINKIIRGVVTPIAAMWWNDLK